MKLYLHCGDDFTMICNVSEATGTVKDVAEAFVRRWNEKKGTSVNVSDVTLSTSSSPSTTAIDFSATVSKAFTDRQDIFVTIAQQQKKPQRVVIDAILKAANELRDKRKFRDAKRMYEQVLKSSPGEPEALLNVGNILNAAGKHSEALPMLLEGSRKNSARADFHVCLAEAQEKTGDVAGAVESLTLAVRITRAVAASEKAPEAVTALEDTTAKLGALLLRTGETDAAMSLFSTVLTRNRSHIPSLLGYATVLERRSAKSAKPDDGYELALEALQVRLGVLVKNAKLAEAKEAITDSLLSPYGMKALFATVQGTAADSASALGFVAATVKDFGAFEQSLELYRRALRSSPDSASCALNAAHDCECLAWLVEALKTLVDFLDSNPALSAGSVSAKQVAELVKPVFSRPMDLHDRPPAPDATLAPGPTGPIPISVTGRYTERELDLLAIYFTVLKVLYTIGYVQFCEPLVRLLTPLREGKDLHLTSIRNEQAYFACVSMLVKDVPLPIDFGLPSIYVVGDSHTLSSAWRTVTVGGRPHLLRPYLVTGLKIWHLREKSRFYPKRNFWSVIEKIPNGATVISLLGEIDCREGLLVAMEKLKYDSIEEGSRATIAIYKKVLEKLQRERGFNILVHPPIPSLKETRPIIHTFAAVLKEEITRASSSTLHFLDIIDQFLTEGWAALKPQYELDSTHLRSTYVPEILEPALAKILS